MAATTSDPLYDIFRWFARHPTAILIVVIVYAIVLTLAYGF